MRSTSVIFIAASALAAAPAPLSAQMFGTISGQTAMNNVIMANVNQRGQRSAHNEDKRKSSTVPAPEIKSVNFNYTPSKPLRTQNVNSFITALSKRHPAVAEDIRSTHQQNDIMDMLDQGIRPSGFTVTNVADAYTIWWMTAWTAVNGEVPRSAHMHQSVKRQVEAGMAATPQFANMNAAQKQTLSEVLLIQTLMITIASSHPALASDLSETIYQDARSLGLDLTKMTLTEDGFVARGGG